MDAVDPKLHTVLSQHGGAGSALTTEPPLHFVTIPTVLSIQETPQIMSLTHLRAYTMTIQG